MKSPEVQRDFSEFLGSLNDAGVRYLVVGAYALAAHGVPRNTLDLDVFVQPTRANGRRVVEALSAFGFASLRVEPEDFSVPDRILQLGRQPIRIDLLTSITGVSWQKAWAGRTPGRYGSIAVHYLGRSELVENKSATGRLKDKADVAALTGTSRRRSRVAAKP